MDVGEYISHHITDHAWTGCTAHVFGLPFTWMSDGIATMLLAAVVVMALVIPAARRAVSVPGGFRNALEVIVVFVRDSIARPALHDKAERFLPFLLTLFVFILGMNLTGLLPLAPLSGIVTDALRVPAGSHYGIGGAPTGIMGVCGALALLTLSNLLYWGLWRAAANFHHRHRGIPLVLCLVFSPLLWVLSLSHPVPGVVGKLLLIPMAALEFLGVFAKVFALMIRLFANMLSGHALVAVLLMFIFQMSAEWVKTSFGQFAGVGVTCVISSVLLSLLDLLVAGLQAYVFVFLSAIYLGLYIEPAKH